MKSEIKPLFLGLLLVILNSCSSSNNNGPTSNTPGTYAELSEHFNNLNLPTGINDVSLVNTHGAIWNFRVILPDVDMTNNKRPLIMVLHGASGGDPNAHKTTDCYAEPAFSSIDPIIISPNGGSLLWFDPPNQELVLTLVQLAIDNLAVDTSKIVVAGYSNGANGSWFFAETHPEIFAAGIPIASSYSTYNTNNQPRLIETPIYAIQGGNDELFPLEDTREWVEASKSVGSDITLEVAPGLTHNQPCDYTPYVKHAVNWLNQHVW